MAEIERTLRRGWLAAAHASPPLSPFSAVKSPLSTPSTTGTCIHQSNQRKKTNERKRWEANNRAFSSKKTRSGRRRFRLSFLSFSDATADGCDLEPPEDNFEVEAVIPIRRKDKCDRPYGRLRNVPLQGAKRSNDNETRWRVRREIATVHWERTQVNWLVYSQRCGQDGEKPGGVWRVKVCLDPAFAGDGRPGKRRSRRGLGVVDVGAVANANNLRKWGRITD